MARLNKMCYFTKSGEKKLNRYYLTIDKEIAKQLNIDENTELEIKIKDNKIIIEKSKC